MTIYVPTGGGGGGGLAFVTTADTASVDLSGDGTPGTPLSAAVIAAFLAAVTTSDTGTVDFSGAGTGGSPLSAIVPDNSITYAKMQDVSATDRVLARDTAGAGDVEEVTPAAMRTMLDVPLNAAAVLQTLADAKGDLAVATAADTFGRLAVGANGKVLTADSAAGTGLVWIGNIAYAEIAASDMTTAITVGDGKAGMIIPANLTGMNLVQCAAGVIGAVSTAGLPTVQLRRFRPSGPSTVDMLSTKITIDANEWTSASAATPPVIDGANDDVVTGDIIYVDVDVSGTGAKGLIVSLGFQLP